MNPAKHDFDMQKGTYGSRGAIVLQFLEADNTPTDLTGAVVTFVCPMANILKSTADSSLALNSQTSQVSWLPTEAEIAGTPRGRWAKYYVEIAFSDGSGLRFMEGYLIGMGV